MLALLVPGVKMGGSSPSDAPAPPTMAIARYP